jgi:surface antigen
MTTKHSLSTSKGNPVEKQSRVRRAAFSIVAFATAVVGSVGLSNPAAAATAVRVHGTVECSGGKAVVGIWINSSGGGSKFADWTPYPGRPHVAVYSATVSTNFSTNLRLDVGCGGSKATWGSNNKTPELRMSSGTSNPMNALACGASVCKFGTKENNTPAAPGSNTFASKQNCWCTYLAAERWRSMTGRFPNWSGNANRWDDNASSTGWSVTSSASPRSIFVDDAGKYGHVGYVKDVRITSGKVQIKIDDRNSNGSCTDAGRAPYDRSSVWIDVKSTMKFIVPPPVGAI